MSHHTLPTLPSPASAPVCDRMIALLQSLLTFAPDPPPAPSGRGAPPTFPIEQLWLAVLLGLLKQTKSLRKIWRGLVQGPLGTFPPLHVGYEAVRSRLLEAGTDPLQDLFVRLHQGIALWAQSRPLPDFPLAHFAPAVMALDETTCDQLKRLTPDLRKRPSTPADVQAGKLAGLFDLRLQQWVRLQFRADVPAHCSTDLLPLLDGLLKGTLLLADLGYFGFPWFDLLTERGLFWISRLKDRVTFSTIQVFYQDESKGMLDALVWLGAYRSDQAAQAVRLVQYRLEGITYQYLTNVLDPAQLTMLEVAQLYARRWDIELAFKTLKREVGIAIWWGNRQELVFLQLWMALILAQLLHLIRLEIALQAGVEPFDVSLSLLVELLGSSPAPTERFIEYLVQKGEFLGLIRPSRRKVIHLPAMEGQYVVSVYQGAPPARKARYAGRNGYGARKPFTPIFRTQMLL